MVEVGRLFFDCFCGLRSVLFGRRRNLEVVGVVGLGVGEFRGWFCEEWGARLLGKKRFLYLMFREVSKIFSCCEFFRVVLVFSVFTGWGFGGGSYMLLGVLGLGRVR